MRCFCFGGVCLSVSWFISFFYYGGFCTPVLGMLVLRVFVCCDFGFLFWC